MDVKVEPVDSPEKTLSFIASGSNTTASTQQLLSAAVLLPFQLMDEDGWNRFTKDLDPEYPAVPDDFFEQVEQINYYLATATKMIKIEETDDFVIRPYSSEQIMDVDPMPIVKSEVIDPNSDTDCSDDISIRRVKRCRMDDSKAAHQQEETDHYKFEDSSSASDSGSSSPYEFGPCSSSSGSINFFSPQRPKSLSFFRDCSCSISSTDCYGDVTKCRSNFPFHAESEANIPSPTPPANDTNPSSCAAILEHMGNSNEAPISAPLANRASRSPRTSLQTMTGSGSYSEWGGEGASLSVSDSLPSNPTRRHSLSKSSVRSSTGHLPVRPHVPPMPASGLNRHRSVHARKTPHYPARPQPSSTHSDRIADPRRSGLYPRPHSTPGARNIVSRPVTSVHQDHENADGQAPRLWKFLYDLLEGEHPDPELVVWTDRNTLTFRLVNSQKISQTWGQMKNKPNMCYESLGRSLRYYYAKDVLEKVETTRLSYRFKREHLRNNGIII